LDGGGKRLKPFKTLDKKFEGDIEFYTQYVSTIDFGKNLYGLESKSTLDRMGLKL